MFCTNLFLLYSGLPILSLNSDFHVLILIVLFSTFVFLFVTLFLFCLGNLCLKKEKYSIIILKI